MPSSRSVKFVRRLNGLIQFDYFSDSLKLYKHLKKNKVGMTKGWVQRQQFPSGYYSASAMADPGFDPGRAAAPKKSFISILRGESKEASIGMSPIDTLWHEAGHKFRKSSQVNSNNPKYGNIHQIAAERGANRQTMKLADQLGVSPESRVRIRNALKKSFKTYKQGLFDEKHWSMESGREIANLPVFKDRLTKTIKGKNAGSVFDVAKESMQSLTAMKHTMRKYPWLRGYKFSAARDLFNKVIEFGWISNTKSLLRDLRKNVVQVRRDPKHTVSWFSPAGEAEWRPSIGIGRGDNPVFALHHEAGHHAEQSPIKRYLKSRINDRRVRWKLLAERMANRAAISRMSPDIVERFKKNAKKWYAGHYDWAMGQSLQPDIIQATGARAFSARSLFDKVIQFKTLYIPGYKDEAPEELPKFKEGGSIDYTVQRHAARRAGLHRDVRIGTKRHGLYSWATRKDLPSEGGRIAVHPQPVHAHDYLGWEGNIPEGKYGAGNVSTEHLGKALVTKSTPTEVHATLANQKEHHRLALLKTPRGWLMTRGKNPEPPKEAQKPKYKSVEPDKAHEALDSLEEGSIVQPKVDGALVYVTTKGNRPEIFSHRKGKNSGRNIIHTERFFHGRPSTNIPREHQRTLIGELYGTRSGKAIEPQELGGILNTHLGESIAKQKARGVKLKIMPFDYANGKREPYPERLAKVKKTLEYLPQSQFHPPEEARTPGAARRLFDKVQKGQHPLTKEGVIIHPPTGKMIKIKNTEEANVPITGTYPGTGKFEGSHGGFTYDGGRVGTGFTDETRRRLHKYVGRVARIRHQGKYPSGAYRAPAFIGVDENK